MVFHPFIHTLRTWYLVAFGCGLPVSIWHLLEVVVVVVAVVVVVCWLPVCFSLATSTDWYIIRTHTPYEVSALTRIA